MFACIASFYTRPWWQWVDCARFKTKAQSRQGQVIPRFSMYLSGSSWCLSGQKMQLVLILDAEFCKFCANLVCGRGTCPRMGTVQASLFQCVSRLVSNAGDLTIHSYSFQMSYCNDLAVSGWSCACEWQEAAASLRLSIGSFFFQIRLHAAPIGNPNSWLQRRGRFRNKFEN